MHWYRYINSDTASDLWCLVQDRMVASPDWDAPTNRWAMMMAEMARIADTVNPW